MVFDLESLVRPNIRNLQPYRCARDDYSSGILLDANENAYGSCVIDPAYAMSLNRYPDPHQRELRARIAAWRQLPSEEFVFVGSGSDEAIDLLLRVFCEPGRDRILICPPTYGMYSVSAAINNLQVDCVPLIVDDFQLDVGKVRSF